MVEQHGRTSPGLLLACLSLKPRRGAARIESHIGPTEGALYFVLRRFRMDDRGGMPLHTNEVEHEPYVLRGAARIRIGDTVHEVHAHDTLFIPGGVPHSYDVVEAPFEFRASCRMRRTGSASKKIAADDPDRAWEAERGGGPDA